MEKGPALKEKKLLAQYCEKQANEVMSEQEHQEYLGRAWRLENDWQDTEDLRAERHGRHAQGSSQDKSEPRVVQI